MLRLASILTVILVLAAGPARADANAAFNDAVSNAYGGYRAATSYLRTGNAGLASLELAGALDVWDGIVKTYADNPPPAYTKDTGFAETLVLVDNKLKGALSVLEAGGMEQAADALEPVRDILYDMRKRNGVRLYADCVTELNRAVEPLYKHRHLTPDLGIAMVRQQITDQSKDYENLLLDCKSMAPKAYTGDEEFKRLMDGTLHSIRSMYPAIDSEEPGRVINVLRELRSFDRIIYFRFGG